MNESPDGLPAAAVPPDPLHVQAALDNWDDLVFFAYSSFVKSGKVVVCIDHDPNSPTGASVFAVPHEYYRAKPDPNVVRVLDAYDPELEVVVQYEVPGGLRTRRLRTGPVGRHPKRVYFFEMLRRVQEEPDTIDFASLPEWFVQAADRLSELARQREGQGPGAP